MKEILHRLCADKGISGSEDEMRGIIRELAGDIAGVRSLPLGSIAAEMGDPDAKKHIMLDAHIDRIGLIVTYIDDEGFIKAEPVGGIDLRTLAGNVVTVYGKEELTGVICTVPPHLSRDNKALTREAVWIDTALPVRQVRELVQQGDSVLVCSAYTELLGNKISCSALDNRAGCAVLIRCMQLLRDKELPCRLSVVFSSQEETHESGAETAAFILRPDEAVVIDAGYGRQQGVPKEKSGKLGSGSIISIAPSLSRGVTDKLIALARELNMASAYEVCGGKTGTNADKISVSAGGVRTGCISFPDKNMHTQTEMVSLDDLEKLSQLLALYVLEGGASHA